MGHAVIEVKTAVYRDIKSRNRPSFYAPPLAWAVANFTQSLLENEDKIEPHHTGLIVVSDECSLSTIQELSRMATRGAISPLRFAGSSPSIVAGVTALEQGLRGPTLCLTMAPEHAANAIAALVKFWMRHNKVVSVIAVAHFKQSDGSHLFKGLIARSDSDELNELCESLCLSDSVLS
jgi:3-oxoacyl-(acyl-carrier-protein) synthase